jgi:hypothetical protein
MADGYYYLKHYEVVQFGDEYDSITYGTWIPVQHTVGRHVYINEVGKYRRPKKVSGFAVFARRCLTTT